MTKYFTGDNADELIHQRVHSAPEDNPLWQAISTMIELEKAQAVRNAIAWEAQPDARAYNCGRASMVTEIAEALDFYRSHPAEAQQE